MTEQHHSVFAEFEATDRKLAKYQKRIRRARLTLIFICLWSAYISVSVLLGSKIAYVHPAFVLCYIASYLFCNKWPGISLCIAAILWAWNIFISCIERFVILTTSYYRDNSIDHWGADVYLSFTLELAIKIFSLLLLLSGVVAAIRHRIIIRSPLQ